MKKSKNLSSFPVLYIVLCISYLLYSSCNRHGSSENEHVKTETEQIVEGFDYTKSDSAAVSIANQVMKTMGGRKNWNNARFFTWNFFGEQRHFWDKQTGDVRIESLNSNLIILMNIPSKKGKVFINGQEITHQDSLKRYLEMGEQMWANDSYWLVMPFRLIEPGVILKYLGEDVAQTGETTDVIEVTFTEGIFKNRKHLVYISKTNRFVIQWSIYSKSESADPTYVTEWSNYEKYNNIWLASGRGSHEITEIAVVDSFPSYTFNTPQPVIVN